MQLGPNSTIVVKKISDLETISKTVGVAVMPRVNKLVFDLDHVDRSRQLAWERRLNAYLNSCGCTAGSIVTLASFGITIFPLVVIARDRSTVILALLLLVGLILSTLVGLVAKLVSQLITRTQIRMTVNDILKSTQDNTAPFESHQGG